MLRFTRWRFASRSPRWRRYSLFFVLLMVLGFGYQVLVVSTALSSLVYFLFLCAIWGVFYDPNSSWIPWLVVAGANSRGLGFDAVMDILVNRIGVGLHPMVLLPVVAFLTSSLCFGLFYPLFRTRGE